MKQDENVSPGFAQSFRHAIYNSSIATSASTSSASVWSDASSQSSDDTSVSGNSSDGESCDSRCYSKQTSTGTAKQIPAAAVPAELRQNPRRTAAGSNARGCPPPLVRQSDRKINFVDSLVGRLMLQLPGRKDSPA